MCLTLAVVLFGADQTLDGLLSRRTFLYTGLLSVPYGRELSLPLVALSRVDSRYFWRNLTLASWRARWHRYFPLSPLDTDVVINRTLVYGSLTVMLGCGIPDDSRLVQSLRLAFSSL